MCRQITEMVRKSMTAVHEIGTSLPAKSQTRLCERASVSTPTEMPSPTARRSAPPRPGNHGFALLEVLVALSIAVLALAALFQLGFSGLRSTQAASHYEQAIARARSRLTLAVHAKPLISGVWDGDDGGGFTWHLQVAPIARTMVRPQFGVTARGSTTFPLTLYVVGVSIAWRDGDRVRHVDLVSEQIAQGAR